MKSFVSTLLRLSYNIWQQVWDLPLRTSQRFFLSTPGDDTPGKNK